MTYFEAVEMDDNHDIDAGTTLAVIRALQLNGCQEKLARRLEQAQEHDRVLDELELEINTNAGSQRESIISELEHLKEIIDCKKEQLLQKSALELQRKQALIAAQRQKLGPEMTKTKELSVLVEKIQGLCSGSTYLAVVHGAVTEAKAFLKGVEQLYLPSDAMFRPFCVDHVIGVAGDLDLGPLPGQAPKPNATFPGQAGAHHMVHQPVAVETVPHIVHSSGRAQVQGIPQSVSFQVAQPQGVIAAGPIGVPQCNSFGMGQTHLSYVAPVPVQSQVQYVQSSDAMAASGTIAHTPSVTYRQDVPQLAQSHYVEAQSQYVEYTQYVTVQRQ